MLHAWRSEGREQLGDAPNGSQGRACIDASFALSAISNTIA